MSISLFLASSSSVFPAAPPPFELELSVVVVVDVAPGTVVDVDCVAAVDV